MISLLFFVVNDRTLVGHKTYTGRPWQGQGQFMDYKKHLHVGIKACRAGREVLLYYLGHLSKVQEKHHAGLVSEADQESEKVISQILSQEFPETEFLGEESAYEGKTVANGRAGSRGRWILDPLDGTTNYIHGFSYFCISLAFEHESDIKVGVIDIPMLGETYTSVRGQGAFVNGQPLHVSTTKNLKDSLLATGFFADDVVCLDEQLRIFSDLVRKCRGVRRAGAAAIDLCMVARGVFDAYWERNLKPWDAAAGQLLVEEAGGKVWTYRGMVYDPYKNSLIASNPFLAPILVENLQSYINSDTH